MRALRFAQGPVDDVFDAINGLRSTFQPSPDRRPSIDSSKFEANPHQNEAKVEDAALGQLINRATLERYKPGDVIIADGTKHHTLFNIAKGRVAVEVQRMNEESHISHAVKILTLYQGAMFGEMSFLSGAVACSGTAGRIGCFSGPASAASATNLRCPH